MIPLTTATLTTVFSDVLANLAFMFTDGDQTDPSPEATWLETTIGYHGPATGRLRLQCTSEFGVLLAANLLGIDSKDEDAQLKTQDAVKEFMNIVCGQFVTEVHGTDDVFDLTIPATRTLGRMPDFLSCDDEWASILTVEGHCIQLTYAPGQSADRPQKNH